MGLGRSAMHRRLSWLLAELGKVGVRGHRKEEWGARGAEPDPDPTARRSAMLVGCGLGVVAMGRGHLGEVGGGLTGVERGFGGGGV